MSGPCCAQRATEWVVVSTGMFTSFLFEPDFDVVNLSNRNLHALGSWDTQVTVTHRRILPPDHGDLSASAADRQRGGVCCRRNDLLPAVGGYRGARNAADVQQKPSTPCPPWSSCGQIRMTPCCAIAPPSPGGWRVADGRHMECPPPAADPGHCRLAADRALIFSHRTE